jgi:hypothetical protein
VTPAANCLSIRYELQFEDTFSGDSLDLDRWLP